MFGHQLKQINQGNQIVPIIFQRFFYRFTHCFAGSKMNNSLNTFIFSEHGIKSFQIQTVKLFKSRTYTGYLFYVIYHIGTRIGQIIDDYHLITCILKLYNGMRTNISGSTCH